MAANYRQIGGPNGHLAKLEPFKGNSMSARVDEDGVYSIFSYRTMIGFYKNGELTDFGKRYSVTTSKHQGQMRAWTGRAKQNA